jgi:hypothetical protein
MSLCSAQKLLTLGSSALFPEDRGFERSATLVMDQLLPTGLICKPNL